MQNIKKSGINFTEALQIAFIVLKLCGVIGWSWIWVLCPIWVNAVFYIGWYIYTIIFD